MDKELKARNLASATVRKQRIQDRQKQKELMYTEREERKQRMLRYSEVYHTDSDKSWSNSPENDSAAGTPSEGSVATPDNSFYPDVEIKIQEANLITKELTQRADVRLSIITPKLTILERRLSKTTSVQPTMLGASLHRLCDFRYDRYSTIIEPESVPVVEEADEKEQDISSSDDGEESDEDYSPIEVVTPMAIRMSISRPSVKAVFNGTSPVQGLQKFSMQNINTIMVNPPNPVTRPVSRPILRQPFPQAQTSELVQEQKPHNKSGFLASEARPVEVLTSSSASVTSTPSFTSMLSTVEQQSVDNTLKKKSSMPMLHKFTHARMNSFKNFMKPQSISGPPPAVPMIPTAHQTRPSASVNQIPLSLSTQNLHPSRLDANLPPSPRRALTEPNLLKVVPPKMQRPQTARAPSQTSIRALPPPPPHSSTPTEHTPPLPPNRTYTPSIEDTDPNMSRKKSFQNLRRRSSSLGQALKFPGTKGKLPTPEHPPPPPPLPLPLPVIRVPAQNTGASTPQAAKTPRTVRRSAIGLYSPFPAYPQRGEPVGLGLRM